MPSLFNNWDNFIPLSERSKCLMAEAFLLDEDAESDQPLIFARLFQTVVSMVTRRCSGKDTECLMIAVRPLQPLGSKYASLIDYCGKEHH